MGSLIVWLIVQSPRLCSNRFIHCAKKLKSTRKFLLRRVLFVLCCLGCRKSNVRENRKIDKALIARRIYLDALIELVEGTILGIVQVRSIGLCVYMTVFVVLEICTYIFDLSRIAQNPCTDEAKKEMDDEIERTSWESHAKNQSELQMLSVNMGSGLNNRKINKNKDAGAESSYGGVITDNS